jgi:sigma-B regulation protein RsbU (phosphoserine phosphatase)
MIGDPWRTRLIAAYSLAMGIVGWLVLLSATQRGDWLTHFWPILLAVTLVASGALLQRLTQAYNRLEKRVSELEALQEEAWAATALLQVAEAVGSLTGLDEVLETVVRITPILVGVDRCTILLWQDESQEFVAAKGYARQREAEPIFTGLRFHPGDVPLLDELRARGAPIVLEETDDTKWIPAALVQEYCIGNLLALPLHAQGEIHGAMLADYMNSRDHFTDRKKAILSGIADQAAMAIANARSHDAQREEAWVSTALLQVAQAFISSADLSDNISKIARLTPLLAGVDRCMIFLWEKDRGEFVPYQAHGLNKEAMQVFWNLRFKPGDLPLLDEVVRRQNHVALENAAESDLIPQSLLHSFGIQSVLAVPLISKGEMLGAFLVDCTQCPTRFPPRKISIVEGIAHQTAIAVENAHLYEAVLAQERMTQELRLASEIQASFLPETCPFLRGWEIAADWHAAREVGGDFYDFIPLGPERLGLVIADVSDKGVPAALFMSLSRTLVRASALDIRSPAKVLQHVNELIMADARSGMFVTMFYGVLNRRTGQFTYASAGHNPPVWWRRAESQMTTLTAKGVVVGVAEDIVLEERQVVVQPGDIVVLYTDGVTEPINGQVEEFGEERLMHTIAEASDRPCNELVHLIHDTVSAFVGDQPQFDDYTLVAVKRQM